MPLGFLCVPVGTALRHCAHRAHAAVGLESTALVEDGFAGALFGAGEQAADHDAVGAGRDGLGDVARILDAAVGDERNAGLSALPWRASAMAVICGTPAPETTRVVQIEPGPMPTLTPSAPSAISSRAPSKVATLPAMSSTSGNCFLMWLTASSTRLLWPWAVSITSTSTLLLTSSLRALQEIAGRADGRADTQTSLLVLGGVRVLEFLLDVLNGDQALEVVLVVDHQQFFHAVLVQDLLGLFERGADGDGDQVFLGHHLGDGNVGAGLEAQIAVGEDADQFAVLGDGDAGDAVAAHEFQGVGDLLVGSTGDGVDDHAAFRAFYTIDFLGLPLDRHVLVNDPDAALRASAMARRDSVTVSMAELRIGMFSGTFRVTHVRVSD